MAAEFVIRQESELPATPEQVWEAVATGAGTLGWLFPMEIEPRVGGVVSRGPSTVTVWDPPRRFACRYEIEEGFSAVLEYLIEPHDSGNTILRTVIRRMYCGMVGNDWEARIDSVSKHVEFYQHTLGQYLRYFSGRTASFVQVYGPAASAKGNAFTVLRRRLGLTAAAEGEQVRLTLRGLDPLNAVVDYLTPHFIGLRAADGLYRFLGGNTWGWPIGLSLHLFADDIDQQKTEQAWRVWLDGVFA
jgi:hypothetical protein